MKELNWNHFILLAAASTMLYYLLLLLIFYRRRVLRFFEGQAKGIEGTDQPFTSYQDATHERAENRQEDLNHGFEVEMEVDQFCQKLRTIFMQSRIEDRPEDLHIGILGLLKQYPMLCQEELRPSIEEMILQEAKDMQRELSQKQMDRIWKSIA